MPSPGWKRHVGPGVERLRRGARAGQRVRQRHRVARGVRRRDELLGAGLAVRPASAREGHVTSYVPRPDDSRVTWPAPSISEPSQWVFEVRVVAMGVSFVVPGTVRSRVLRTEPCRVGDNRQVTTSTRRTAGPQARPSTTRSAATRRSRRSWTASTPAWPTDEVLRPLYPEADLGPAAGAVHAVPRAVLGRPDDVLRAARAPAAADAARAVRGDAAGQGALAAALPRRARRGRTCPPSTTRSSGTTSRTPRSSW